MRGKNIRRFEHYYGDTADQFISDFISRRNEIVANFARLANYDGTVKDQVDLKAYMESLMDSKGKPDLVYPFYRAVRRYAFAKHGEPLVYRHMSIQGFYLDVLINYLRLPPDYGLDDLVEYVVSNSMIIKSIVEGAFPQGRIGYSAYSFLYQRVARSEEYGDHITAVTGNQFGRGGNQGNH